MKNENGWIGPFAAVMFVIGLLTILIVSMIYGVGADSNCKRGGYSSYRSVSGVGLCLGVEDVDGVMQWQIEPLDDVRARLEAN